MQPAQFDPQTPRMHSPSVHETWIFHFRSIKTFQGFQWNDIHKVHPHYIHEVHLCCIQKLHLYYHWIKWLRWPPGGVPIIHANFSLSLHVIIGTSTIDYDFWGHRRMSLNRVWTRSLPVSAGGENKPKPHIGSFLFSWPIRFAFRSLTNIYRTAKLALKVGGETVQAWIDTGGPKIWWRSFVTNFFFFRNLKYWWLVFFNENLKWKWKICRYNFTCL